MCQMMQINIVGISTLSKELRGGQEKAVPQRGYIYLLMLGINKICSAI